MSKFLQTCGILFIGLVVSLMGLAGYGGYLVYKYDTEIDAYYINFVADVLNRENESNLYLYLKGNGLDEEGRDSAIVVFNALEQLGRLKECNLTKDYEITDSEAKLHYYCDYVNSSAEFTFQLVRENKNWPITEIKIVSDIYEELITSKGSG